MADYGKTKAVIYVEGMTCSHCEKAVEEALLKLEGISEASADASVGIVDISFDNDTISMDDITEEIEEIGYSVQEVREAEV